jgi:glutamyl-tRNA reductase
VLPKPDIVVTSIGGNEWILSRDDVAAVMEARRNQRLFLIDLGVPRNIDPAAGELYNVFLYNLDDLKEIVEQNRQARASEVPRAEEIIAEHTAKFSDWQSGSEAAVVLAELRDKLRLERELFTARMQEDLQQFAPADRERVMRMMDDWAEHLLREPSTRLLKDRDVRERVAFLRDLFGLGAGDKPGRGSS